MKTRQGSLRVWTAWAMVVVGLGLGGCAAPPRSEPTPPRLAEWDAFEPTDDGSVYLGAQPSEAALDAFAARGGRVVINLRTDEEMAFLPYYDRAVTSRGLEYVRIPTGGATLGAGTEAAIADAMAGVDGPVLLHCASGGRATYAWALHRMAAEGLSAEEAAAWAASRREKPWEAGEEKLRAFEAEQSGN